MTPPHQYERRRADDVYKAIEEDVFPRIVNLELDVKKLTVEGCAHRQGDLLRTQSVELNMGKIFDKIDDIGSAVSEARVDRVKQVGGIKAWVLTGVVIILLSVAGFFLQRHYDAAFDRVPPAVGAPR